VRDVYDVLREKENAVERARQEVEVLRSVAPLLANETERSKLEPAVRREATTEKVKQLREALRTVAPLLADEAYDLVAKIRARRIEEEANDAKLARAKKIFRQLRRITAPLLGADFFGS
jgi:hypothetical protein